MRFQTRFKSRERVTIANFLWEQVPQMRSSITKSSRSHRSLLRGRTKENVDNDVQEGVYVESRDRDLETIEICLLDLLPYPTPPGHSAFCPLQLHSQPGRCISQHPQAVPVGSAGHVLLKRNTQINKQVKIYFIYCTVYTL